MHGMRIDEFAKLISDERETMDFLYKRKKSISKVKCPFCRSKKFYLMKRKRVRCKECRKDFDFLKETYFGKVRISYSKWLTIIKLFELEVSARKASRQSGLSYPTTLKSYDTIRHCITRVLSKKDKKLKGKIEADEAYFGGRRKGMRGRGSRNKVIVFGILERNGRVKVSIVDDASSQSLMKESVKKIRRGSIVYTDKWRGYDSLMFCGYKHLQIDHAYKFKQDKVYINGIEGFWSFAKERLIKHHGVSPRKFLYYIKEQEWRYNNRGKDLFSLLVQIMLGAVIL